jgi:hypothetical protein
MCIILMLYVSAIQGRLQAALMRGVLLHCALPEYLPFIMSLMFSSSYLFCSAAISLFRWCAPDCTIKCAFVFTVLLIVK